MKLQIETSAYNERRYGKPWIAKVTFDSKSTAIFDFGNWVGATGDEGILELDVMPGDVVAQGQKDYRKPAKSAPDFYIVTAETKADDLRDSISKKEAYLHTTQKISKSSLVAEKEQLIERIAKIDELLQLSK